MPPFSNVLGKLGGNHIFALLDQSKTYHQMHMSPVSRKLTVFITPWSFYEWI